MTFTRSSFCGHCIIGGVLGTGTAVHSCGSFRAYRLRGWAVVMAGQRRDMAR